jgi:CTP synthase (UTP-ammonia lyase)
LNDTSGKTFKVFFFFNFNLQIIANFILALYVAVVPHINDEKQYWVARVAQVPVKGTAQPEVCLIELGGTIGDFEGMPFVEAFRQFQLLVKVRESGNFLVVTLN